MSAKRRRRPKWIAPVIALGVARRRDRRGGVLRVLRGPRLGEQVPDGTGDDRRRSTVTVSGSGNAAATRTTSVNPTVSGTVYDLRVSLGSHVTKGQVLFRIKSPSVVQSLAQQEASLKQAQEQRRQREALVPAGGPEARRAAGTDAHAAAHRR